MAGIIIGFILLIGLFGGLIFAVLYQLKKTDPNKIDTSTSDTIETAQDFLPFEDIRDSVIHMGGHHYRAIIECSSVNYDLKTSKEQEMIEMSFQRFLNSLDFPISFFIQTRKIDNTKMLNDLKSELEEIVGKYENLYEYAQNYLNGIQTLHRDIKNDKQKRKYIIIPFCEAIELSELNDDEKYEHSLKELYTRCQMIIESLASVGVNSKILDTKSIAELVYSTYHKDNYTYIEDILNGKCMSLMIEPEKNKLKDITDYGKVDWILYETQKRLETEMLDEDVDENLKRNTFKIISEIESLRDNYAGYYQEKDNYGYIHMGENIDKPQIQLKEE